MAKKTERVGSGVTRGDIYLNPDALFVSQLKEQQKVKTLQVKRLTDAKLNDVVRKHTGKTINGAPVMELSARYPFHANGLIDMYTPGRWDTSSDQVFMDPFVQGPSPGVWTGSVAYFNFKAPAAGPYLLVVHFYGYQISMRLNTGVTAFSSNNASTVLSTVINAASAGANTGFSMNCTGIYLGFLQAIQVFKA